MIGLGELRAALKASPDLEDSLPAIRDAVIAQWEGITGLYWNAREGYVQSLPNPDNGVTSIWLGLRPVLAITKVENRYFGSPTWDELDEGSYLLDGNRLDRVDGLTWGFAVRVTYDGGYDEDSCPADIKRALLVQASFMVARTAPERLIVKGQSFEGGAGTFETADLHPLFKQAAVAWMRRV